MADGSTGKSGGEAREVVPAKMGLPIDSYRTCETRASPDVATAVFTMLILVQTYEMPSPSLTTESVGFEGCSEVRR